MVGWLGDQIGSFAAGVVSGLKDFFGIHSPSTLIEDEIGKNVGMAVGTGMLKSIKDVKRKMDLFNDEVLGGFNTNLNSQVDHMLTYNGTITVESPINVNLDGKPIYQNVVTRITKNQGLRTQFKGGF